MTRGVTVIIPSYREAENLRILLPETVRVLEKTGEPHEIIVVDGTEPFDDSASVCRQYGAIYLNQSGPDWGNAFRTGIRRARQDYGVIVTMDADCSHDPGRIPALLRAIRSGADVAVASRYCPGGRSDDTPVSVLLSGLLNRAFFLPTLLNGFPVLDISGGFRAYRTCLLKDVRLTGRYFDTTVEALLRLGFTRKEKDGRLSVKEIPYVFLPRRSGKTHRHMLSFILSFAALYCKSLFWSMEALIRCRKRH